jgi:hypothetical protein
MIELRWLIDSRSDAHRVLQYRVLGDRTWVNQHECVRVWSKWENVQETVEANAQDAAKDEG